MKKYRISKELIVEAKDKEDAFEKYVNKVFNEKVREKIKIEEVK